MLTVPFTIIEFQTGNKYQMEYKVGFFGCEQNEKKEVYPIQAWVVSSSPFKIMFLEEFQDPIPPKPLDDKILEEENMAKELDELMKSSGLKDK